MDVEYQFAVLNLPLLSGKVDGPKAKMLRSKDLRNVVGARPGTEKLPLPYGCESARLKNLNSPGCNIATLLRDRNITPSDATLDRSQTA